MTKRPGIAKCRGVFLCAKTVARFKRVTVLLATFLEMSDEWNKITDKMAFLELN